VIVAEGPDGSGKTTLLEQLNHDTQLPIAPKLVASDTSVVEGEGSLVHAVEINMVQGLDARLYDRHPLISEMIYGPSLRNGFRPGFEDYRWLRRQQQRLRRHHPLVIFCLPPLDDVVENVKREDNQPMMVVGRIEQVYWEYFALAASWPDPIIWDYTGRAGYGTDNYWQILDSVTDWLIRKGLIEHHVHGLVEDHEGTPGPELRGGPPYTDWGGES
jgi:GTPase SAR1 family protein